MRKSIIILIILCILTGCGKKEQKEITSVWQLDDSRYTIGYGEGHSAYYVMKEFLPNAKLHSYPDHITGFEAVKTGKIDGYAFERRLLELAIKEGLSGVHILKENIGKPIDLAVGISPVTKIPDFENKINTFIAEIRKNGIYDEMVSRWLNGGIDAEMPEVKKAENPVYHLAVGTTGEIPMFTFYKGTELAGFDIELAQRFALWLNADLEFKVYNYGSIIAAATSGDIDCIMANLNVTPERLESIRFSTTILSVENTILVRNTDKTALMSGFKSSFLKTFVRESRWRLIVNGIGITILISILSALFGTVLGFGICALRMSRNRLVNAVSLAYIRIMQGTPMVVLLMIIFYIVFAGSSISGIWVAVIGFGMNFGAYVSEMIRTGILAVDKGQMEAALALGYTKPHAFMKIVLPQAARHFLPVYQGEFISMVKMTSVVGYIAIQDLTKASDIIRSRTFEAFFPLITTAVIYFIIAWLLTRVLTMLQNRLDPRRKK